MGVSEKPESLVCGRIRRRHWLMKFVADVLCQAIAVEVMSTPYQFCQLRSFLRFHRIESGIIKVDSTLLPIKAHKIYKI